MPISAVGGSADPKGLGHLSSAVERHFCKVWVLGSNPRGGSMKTSAHFIGIGGIGISALARYYVSQDWKVTGSDLTESELTSDLRKDGIKIIIGHRAKNIPVDADLVVYSAAVRSDNPELQCARKLGIKTQTYAEALGDITRKYFTFAVCGAHGKSTTTAMLSFILIEAGFDPTVILGTKLREFKNSNFRAGKSEYLVIEADEFNKSFLHHSPQIVVATNVDKEHLDTYGSLANVIRTFAQFFKKVPKTGAIVANRKDQNTVRALQPVLKKKNKPSIMYINQGKDSRWPLQIPGRFNQFNAEAAFRAARFVGVSKSAARRALARYKGSWRRMEQLVPRSKKGWRKGQIFFSDYAHHPTEIDATLTALKSQYPKKELVAVFEPHHIGRLNDLFKEFTTCFDKADTLILLPIYHVAGREKGIEKLKQAKDLFNAMRDRKTPREKKYLKTLEKALTMVKPVPNSVIVFMGAGSIDAEVRKVFRSKLLPR